MVGKYCYECGSVHNILNRYGSYHWYKHPNKKGEFLCPSCGSKGERNAFFGKKHPEELMSRIRLKMGRKLTYEEKLYLANINYGERNPSWKGGVSRIQKTLRQTCLYVRWRTEVFKRDGFRCIKCDSKTRIQAHHIIPFAKIIRDNNISKIEDAVTCSLLWDISNGSTLCYECHKHEKKK